MRSKILFQLLKEDWGKAFWILISLTGMAILITIVMEITLILPLSLAKTFVQAGPTGSILFSRPLQSGERKKIEDYFQKEKVQFHLFSVEKGRYQKAPFPLVILPQTNWKAMVPYWDIVGPLPSKKGEAMMGARLAKHFRIKRGDEIPLVWENQKKKVKIVSLLFSGDGAEKKLFLAQSMGYPKAFDYFLFRTHPKKLKKIESFISSMEIPYQIQLNSQIHYGQRKILEKMKILSLLTLGATLILASITLASVILTRFYERKKEFALLHVLGATPWDYFFLFLGEGLFIGFLASWIGFGAATEMVQRISWQVFHQQIETSLLTFGITLATLWTMAIMMGVFSLRQVLRLEPAELLRGE